MKTKAMKAPLIGRSYSGLPFGQGIVTVVEVFGDAHGWDRVLVEYAAGCCPAPPDDDPQAPEEQWTIPMGRRWISRAEWEDLRPQSL